MRRAALTAIAIGALIVPAAVAAQSPSPGAEGSPGPIGMDTRPVCLEISGPVTLMDAETLTQGIQDGTFVIVGLSDQCEGMMAAASPTIPGEQVEESPTVIEGVLSSPSPLPAE